VGDDEKGWGDDYKEITGEKLKIAKKREIKKIKKKIFDANLVMKVYMSSNDHVYISFGFNVEYYDEKIALNG
jgi:transcription initiation factor IIE alpha subunit